MNKEKHSILTHLIHIIDKASSSNIALIHYVTNNNKDYYILIETSENQIAGKIFQIEQEEDDESYVYNDIPFDLSNKIYFYFIDDLIESLLLRCEKNTIVFDSIYSHLIRKNYQKEWIHNLTILFDNLNILDNL